MLYKVSAFLGWMIRLRSCQSGAIILVDCFSFMRYSEQPFIVSWSHYLHLKQIENVEE